MPPDSELQWHRDAAEDFAELVARRSDQKAVRECVEHQLFALADNPDLGTKWDAPGSLYHYLFQCKDGETVLYIRVVFERLLSGKLGIAGCSTVIF